MDEDLVGLHDGQLLRISSAPSLKTVSRPGSPPGARTSANRWPGDATIRGSFTAAIAALRASRRSCSLTFLTHTLSGRGGCARRPPTVPGACAPVIVPRRRGTRDTPFPFPDQRTE